jgi:hypothetical protein
METAREEIYEGRGFVTLRGLDVDAFSPEDLAAVYLGLSSYIAERRGKQDQRGTMLMHVFDRKIPWEREDLVSACAFPYLST